MTIVQRARDERPVIPGGGGGGEIALRSYTATDE